MTHEEAFLADILETPDDDAPRLIFADWLEENGDPDRAEFIRVQVAGARDPDPRGKGYLARAGTLLERNWDRWVVPLYHLVGPERYERWLTRILSVARTTAAGHFERGFVSALSMGTHRFLERAEAIHRLAPVIDLSLHGAGGCGLALASCPSLQWIRSLGFLDFFTSPVDAGDLAALADSPFLGRLSVLRLQHHNLGDEGVAELVRATWLPQIVELDLTENGLSHVGFRALARCTRLPRLRVLRLSSNALGDETIPRLAEALWRGQLDTLVMRKTELSAAGQSALRDLMPGAQVVLE